MPPGDSSSLSRSLTHSQQQQSEQKSPSVEDASSSLYPHPQPWHTRSTSTLGIVGHLHVGTAANVDDRRWYGGALLHGAPLLQCRRYFVYSRRVRILHSCHIKRGLPFHASILPLGLVGRDVVQYGGPRNKSQAFFDREGFCNVTATLWTCPGCGKSLHALASAVAHRCPQQRLRWQQFRPTTIYVGGSGSSRSYLRRRAQQRP